MNKPEILSDEQVVEWLTTNRGEETLKSYCCGENPVNSLIVEHYGREAQREADVAYYEPLFKQARREVRECLTSRIAESIVTEVEELQKQGKLCICGDWLEFKAKYLGK